LGVAELEAEPGEPRPLLQAAGQAIPRRLEALAAPCPEAAEGQQVLRPWMVRLLPSGVVQRLDRLPKFLAPVVLHAEEEEVGSQARGDFLRLLPASPCLVLEPQPFQIVRPAGQP